jgi:CRP-like cAMP-binding protein
MTIENLEAVLKGHPFLADVEPDHIATLVSCASNRVYGAGEFLCREGEQADLFFLLRDGTVALEVHLPQGGGLRIATLDETDILGWSWLIAPYKWRFDARAIGKVRALALDGRCLRAKCEADHELGYQLLKRFAGLIERRLTATRLQLIDVYGSQRGIASARR